MQAAVSELDDGARTPVPWRLSRSVADSAGLAGRRVRAERIGDAVRCFGCGSPGLVMERKVPGLRRSQRLQLGGSCSVDLPFPLPLTSSPERPHAGIMGA